VVAASLAPLALLPMLQHLAFTKFPRLDEILQLPSDGIEKALDLAINSRASRECKLTVAELETDVRTHGPVPDVQALLYVLWFRDLQRFENKQRAKKLSGRFWPRLKVWDGDYYDSRTEHLWRAIAYTRVVLYAEKGTELPQPPSPPAEAAPNPVV
jgi:hypothetical protein